MIEKARRDLCAAHWLLAFPAQSEVAENWINGGAVRAKTLVGLATYGRTFTLADPTDTRVGARATGRELPAPTAAPGASSPTTRWVHTGHLLSGEYIEVSYEVSTQQWPMRLVHSGAIWVHRGEVHRSDLLWGEYTAVPMRWVHSVALWREYTELTYEVSTQRWRMCTQRWPNMRRVCSSDL